MTLIYPQLSTGTLGQFPIRKRRTLRTVSNRAADGSAVKLADPAAELVEWQLAYTSLTDAEADALQEFFEAAEGSLNEFTFLDPVGNLLSWSGDLEASVWETSPLLHLTAGVADPEGGHDAWRLDNAGVAAQAIAQSLGAPGEYVYCLSAYARANAPTLVSMTAGAERAGRKIGTAWSRISLTTENHPEGESVTFGLEVPAGASIEVYGMQVEAQAAPSGYKPATTGGVYESARLADDVLSIMTTGENRHSCTVKIIHANHF